MAQEIEDDRRNPGEQKAAVQITICSWLGQPIDDAVDVSLVGEDETVKLTKIEATPVYVGRVRSGTYAMQVSSGNHVSPDRNLVVDTDPTFATAYIGEPTWPFYRLGQSAVPFPPPGPQLAVAFPNGAPDPEEIKRLTARITKELPLEAASPDYAKDSEGFIQAEGAIWLFRLTQRDTAKLRADLHGRLLEIIGDRARVGVPVDLSPGQITVMDNQFVVRFREDLDEEQINDYIAKARGTTLRRLSQARNLRLVAFPPGKFTSHLKAVEAWHEAGILVYGEPDIMGEFIDDAFPEDPPNDPTYASQANLTLQNIDLAWQMLDVAAPQKTLGDPDVIVASLDRGLDTDHPDIGGALSDGAAQVLRCYDFSGLRECTVPGYQPDNSHGMGVYGIIAALTNNNDDMSGIAPNTRQIVMERPSLTSVNYPDVLLWAAGFETGNPSAGWPAEPLAEGADIINCSHGRNNLALSGIMDDTLTLLATAGRGGLGTVVVYSAGNGAGPAGARVAQLITGFRVWAAHPGTLAISNSRQPDGMGVERIETSPNGPSNFGPEIDICAQGTNAPSLNATGGEQTFGGTSAAAPTVAAAAALILTANSGLRLEEVRAILRDTAVKIDPDNTDATRRWRDVNGLISTAPGYAGPNFSQWYGFGRLDVAAAVERAGWRLTLFAANEGEFGNVCRGETKDMMLTLSNSGVNTIPITGIASSAAEFIVPEVLSLPFTIEPGNAIQVPIRFQPTSLGTHSGTIAVEAGLFQSRTIDVSGVSQAPELVLIFPTEGGYGDVCVGQHRDLPLTLHNRATCPLTVTNISSSSGQFTIADVQSFPLRIAAGSALTVPIRFSPTGFGAHSATITVVSDDPAGPGTVSVEGRAPSGKLAVTGSTCIGGVKPGCLGEREITICNIGDCKLKVSSVVLKHDSKYWKLVNNPFPASLHPGSCLNVLIRYKGGQKCPTPNKLIIKSDDPKTPKKKLRLLAYTGGGISAKGCGCGNGGNGASGCGGCHDTGCNLQSLDPCCWDEGERYA